MTSLHIDFETGYELSIVKTRKSANPVKQFTRIAPLQFNNSYGERLDLLDRLGELSPAAFRLFLELKCAMNYRTNLSYLKTKGLSQSQRNTRSKAKKELELQQLVIALPRTTLGSKEVKYKRGTFMINPYLLYPPNENVVEAQLIWKQANAVVASKLKATQ